MQYRSNFAAASATLLGLTLVGCGVARQLTTQHRTYTYAVDLPPAPANSRVTGQFAVDQELQDTYRKYHGGVDWTRLSYRARNSSSIRPATLKLYVSLTDQVPYDRLDQEAVLIETVALTAGEERIVALDQAPKNEPLRAFLADCLSRQDVDTVHYYVVTTSADPGAVITVQELTTEVRVHGSYF